eukprot:gnl/Hemi2/19481_TR6475_c0_g1_i1.p1 gnl/Hemi2/19481_TR6475_c0_g1~~gnl/Hemi2/19481_TR6475_c0_g1_i1.p1  ORF type:complete len:300 (+),score=96.93 gnl/Hemi2/19481_TR6475_c0_g1_i1:43-900(+)
MKIHIGIDLELEPEELTLQHTGELVRLLQAWSNQLKIREGSHVASPNGNNTGYNNAGQSAPVVTTSSSINSNPPMALAPAAPVDLHALIARLEDATTMGYVVDQVAAELAKIFAESANPDNLLNDFLQAFINVVFVNPSPERVSQQKPVTSFFLIVPRFPESHKMKLREMLIKYVINFLAQKRTINCNRMDFFLHAEAFASLVKLDLVAITGAVNTIVAFIGNHEKRSAGMTMLGKTVELCLQQLTDKCDTEALNSLRLQLNAINDEVFQYDKSYIEQNLGWDAK